MALCTALRFPVYLIDKHVFPSSSTYPVKFWHNSYEAVVLGCNDASGSLFVGSLMLICAVLAALAAGILLAYGVCQAFFGFFRMHSVSAAVAERARRLGTPRAAES